MNISYKRVHKKFNGLRNVVAAKESFSYQKISLNIVRIFRKQNVNTFKKSKQSATESERQTQHINNKGHITQLENFAESVIRHLN